MRPETLEMFTVSKVSGRNSFSAYARARVSGNSRNLQGFGTQNFPGGSRQLSTEGNHNGEPRRGTTTRNHRGEQKKKSNQKASKKKVHIILKKTHNHQYLDIYKLSPQSLSKHSVGHFKTIAMIFGHVFQCFFSKKQMLQNK